MAAGTYDIVIDQGSDFAIEIQVSAGRRKHESSYSYS